MTAESLENFNFYTVQTSRRFSFLRYMFFSINFRYEDFENDLFVL